MDRAARRALRSAVGLAILACVITPAFVASAASPPETRITAPAAASTTTLAPIALAGTATDDGAVVSVGYSIRATATGLWLQADGQWGTTAVEFPATLGAPGTSTSTWSGTWTPSAPGEYAVVATARDDSGAPDPTPAWRRFTVAATPPPADTGYLTVLFGRAIWTTARQCTPLPGAVDLGTVAGALANRGRSATAAAVVTRVKASVRNCWKPYALQASWDDLAQLRDQYGWSVVSNGMTHDDITKMTPAQQYEESCGSLGPLAEHGHLRATGLYAYGGNHTKASIQRDIVSTCFSYGRRYWDSANVRSEMKAPWFQRTISVNGGRCHDQGLPCATADVRNDRVYSLPEQLVSTLPSTADEWTVIQFYRLVSGRTVSGTWEWDCTSQDARAHWTSDPELYCYEDFLRVMDAVPAQVETVDPATVAAAWGRETELSPSVSHRGATRERPDDRT